MLRSLALATAASVALFAGAANAGGIVITNSVTPLAVPAINNYQQALLNAGFNTLLQGATFGFGPGVTEGTFRFTYLGSEAGNTNTFFINNVGVITRSNTVNPGGQRPFDASVALGEFDAVGISLRFQGTTGPWTVGDEEFGIFTTGATEFNTFVIGLDDQIGPGADDDNHDDLLILVEFIDGTPTEELPEPGTLAVLGTALVAAGALRRRRRA